MGNSPSIRSQRVNPSGLSAPCSTSCRMGGASHTGSARSSALTNRSTSAVVSPRRKEIQTDESTSIDPLAPRARRLGVVPFCDAARAAQRKHGGIVAAANVMLEREVNGFTRGLHAGEALDPIHQSRIEDDIGSICGRSTCAFHGDCLYTHLMCTNLKVAQRRNAIPALTVRAHSPGCY